MSEAKLSSHNIRHAQSHNIRQPTKPASQPANQPDNQTGGLAYWRSTDGEPSLFFVDTLYVCFLSGLLCKRFVVDKYPLQRGWGYQRNELTTARRTPALAAPGRSVVNTGTSASGHTTEAFLANLPVPADPVLLEPMGIFDPFYHGAAIARALGLEAADP